jgi:hypothetical protein
MEWIKITDKLPQDDKEYTCYGEDWCGHPFFKAIYDAIKMEWYIIEGKRRMRQFPTHWSVGEKV